MLVNEEYASMLFLLLENLKEVSFSLRVDDPLLGHLHYWDLMAQSSIPLTPPPKKSNAPATPPAHSKAQLSPSTSAAAVLSLHTSPSSPPPQETSVETPAQPTTVEVASMPVELPATVEQSTGNPFDDEETPIAPAEVAPGADLSAAVIQPPTPEPSSNSTPLSIEHRGQPLHMDLRPDTPSDHTSMPKDLDSPRIDLPTIVTASKFNTMSDGGFDHSSPFPNEFDEPESSGSFKAPTVFQHVLNTPPGSGRLPSTPPTPQSTLGTSLFAPRTPAADSLLGTTPSQADLPQLLASIHSHIGLSERHSKLIQGLQNAVDGIKSSLEIRDAINMSLAFVPEFLTSIELVTLDNFAHVTSLDMQYSYLWDWLASVSPATPHVTNILAPLAQLSQLSHLSHAVRCRTFVNASLNRKCFDSILASLVTDTANSPQLNPDRLLANESLRTVFFKLLQDMKQYRFELPENPTDPMLADLAAPQILAPVVPLEPETSNLPPVSPPTSPPPEDSDKPASFKRRKKVVTISEAPATPAKTRVERPVTPPPSSPPSTLEPVPHVAPVIFEPFSSALPTPTPIEPHASPSPPPVRDEAPALNLPSWSLMSPEEPSPIIDSDSDGEEDDTSDLGTWRVVATYGQGRTTLGPATSDLTPVPAAILSSDSPASTISHEEPDLTGSDEETSFGRSGSGNEPGTRSRRNRSFSGNAPSWAKQIQQFPTMGSYRPNTDWLGGSDETSEPESYAHPQRMTIGASPSSTSASPSSPANLPFRFLSANIISEYVPAKKSNNIREDDSSSASSSSSSSEVVKIRALEGEEALLEDSMLYKNSKPADFFILELVSKPALTAKNSLCSGCGDDLQTSSARWCAYSGNFYCPKCHSNKKAVLPARVIKQWNFKPAKVSNYAYDYLQSNWNRPVLDVATLEKDAKPSRAGALGLPIPIKLPLISRNRNSSVSIINHLTLLRERLVSVAEFIRACRNGHRLLVSLAERLHLLWSSTLWSMQDLVDAKSGKLEPLLRKYITMFSSHVRSCDSCSGKGYVCEICTAKEVIYPFEADTASCPNCKALFHESCWKSNPGKCPKCVRVRAIRGKEK